MAGNQALNVNGAIVNGEVADIALTVQGSDWYWTVCAVMTVAMLSFMGLSFMKPRSQRVFHYITAGVVMVAAIAYFSMASHLGWTAITVEFERSDPRVAGITREIYYVRYIDWFITTPLLLLDLLLTAGMPTPSILWAILIDEVMIVTGLVGALVASSYKWGYYTFGCVALFWIVYQLVWEARIHASKISREAGRTFLMCGSLTAFLWMLYPVAWGVCEGGNVISVDGEAIFYGILDLLAKPVFGALLIFGHRNIDPASLGLAIRDYGETDAVHHEKAGHNGVAGTTGTTDATGTTGVTNGTSTAGTTGVTNGTSTTGMNNGTTTSSTHHTTTTGGTETV